MNLKRYLVGCCVATCLVVGVVRCSADFKTFAYTPNGTPIEVIQIDSELAEQDRAALDYYATNTFRPPNAYYTSTSTRKYNCHAYAWFGDPCVWVNFYNTVSHMENLEYFWIDRSYTLFGYSSTPYISMQQAVSPFNMVNKLLYSWGDTSHSANYYLETCEPGWASSKWGQGPQMVHKLNACPYSAEIRGYGP
jgi:hypothetical protein